MRNVAAPNTEKSSREREREKGARWGNILGSRSTLGRARSLFGIAVLGGRFDCSAETKKTTYICNWRCVEYGKVWLGLTRRIIATLDCLGLRNIWGKNEKRMRVITRTVSFNAPAMTLFSRHVHKDMEAFVNHKSIMHIRITCWCLPSLFCQELRIVTS
jgi:hypothetical protein